jgi:spore germination protein Q
MMNNPYPAFPISTGTGQAGAFPGQTGMFPGQTGMFPGQTGMFPGQAGMFQGQTGAFPGQTGAFPGQTPPMPSGSFIPGAPGTPGTAQPGVNLPGQLPLESSYIENILRLNTRKPVTIYMTFENNTQWNAKIFKGILEAAGRDHIIISDPQTGMRTLLLMVNLDYITFDEELNYSYPFG